MTPRRLAAAVARALARVLPRGLHSRRLRARDDVGRLTAEQRERLRSNLAAMLRPDAA